MFHRKIVTLIALALTGVFFLISPLLPKEEKISADGTPILRLWLLDDEPNLSRWLKKQLARFEKEEGMRVYLRTASKEEMENALEHKEGAIQPDLMVMQGLSDPLLYRGYALIIRDEQAVVLTPAPTSALFFRPTATPDPSPTPGPTPNVSVLSPILTPDFLSPALPGCQQSPDAFSAFVAGKAPAALLTAGQAAQLPFGYRAYALKNGEGLVAVNAKALTEEGKQLLIFLQSVPAQQALSDYGLYSHDPSLRLYDASDPIRALIEGGR